jgi:hypothetical protein
MGSEMTYWLMLCLYNYSLETAEEEGNVDVVIQHMNIIQLQKVVNPL